jgi:hypothetical protein
MFTAVHAIFTSFHFVALRAPLTYLWKIKDDIVFCMILDYFHDDYTHTHTHTYTHIHTYIHTYINIHFIHTSPYIHAYIHVLCTYLHT